MAIALLRGVRLRHDRLSAGLVLIQLHPQVSSLLKERDLNGPLRILRKKIYYYLMSTCGCRLLYVWHDGIRV